MISDDFTTSCSRSMAYLKEWSNIYMWHTITRLIVIVLASLTMASPPYTLVLIRGRSLERLDSLLDCLDMGDPSQGGEGRRNLACSG
jgi:hypothetical protein